MRTMLVGVGLLLACLSGAARADEASAVKAVEKLGGKVTRDDKLPGNPVIGVNLGGLFPGKVTDADLKELKHLKQLTTLSLAGAQVTDAGLKELKDLKQLTWLTLIGVKVTDDGVADLQKALPGCKIGR